MNIDILLNEDSSEKVQYASPEIPIYARAAFLSYYPNYRAVSHWHDDFEFMYIRSGHINYSINDTIVNLTAGNGIFINSRHIHYGFSNDFQECEFICVLLHPTLFSTIPVIEEKYLTPLIENTQMTYQLLSQDIDWQKNILDALCNIYHFIQKDFHLLSAYTNAVQIFSELYVHMPENQTDTPCVNHNLIALRQMMNYIQKNYTRKISLQEIALSGKVCKSSCNSIFQHYLHQTPVSYLIEYRLQKSIELMTSTDLSLTNICFEVGFSGLSYYTETFRKYYGCTPKQYRLRQNPTN